PHQIFSGVAGYRRQLYRPAKTLADKVWALFVAPGQRCTKCSVDRHAQQARCDVWSIVDILIEMGQRGRPPHQPYWINLSYQGNGDTLVRHLWIKDPDLPRREFALEDRCRILAK